MVVPPLLNECSGQRSNQSFCIELTEQSHTSHVPAFDLIRSTEMDKDRIAGSAKQAGGAIKEAAGKVTGDAKLKAEGSAEKTAGKVQNAVGGAKDAVRDALK
jgi:uncharacterized protein YjbJ (UPF0337 family)